MPLNVHTRAVISFHTWRDNGFGGGRQGSFASGLFVVLGMQTSKSFGDAAGTFTITLKPEVPGDIPSLLDLWEEPEGVWAMMWFQINGQLFDTMLGNIDTVHEETVRNEDGSRSVGLTISGRDHGKVFAETELFINIFERRGAVPEFALYQALHEEIQFNPSQIVTALIRTWIGNEEVADTIWNLPPSLFGGQQFYRALNKSTIDPNTRGNAQELTILQPDQQGQKLWDALMQYCNPVLNELWVDLAMDPGREFGAVTSNDPVTGRELPVAAVRNLRPAVYLRERPFVSSEFGHLKWDRLPTHDLEPIQYKVTSLAKGSSAERFNYWMLGGSTAQTQSVALLVFIQEHEDALIAGDGQIGNPGTVPIYNLTSIRRFGIRRFNQSTRFFPINDVTIGELATGMVARWLRLLHDWYSVAPREITGTIQSTYAMPWIRIGHRIRLRRKDGRRITFYVEGVQHSYSYPGVGSSSFTVTRGELEGRELLRDVYEALEFVEPSIDDLDAGVPGASLALTEAQARAIREASSTSDAFTGGVGSVSFERDPASAIDAVSAGVQAIVEGISEEREEGDSQVADSSMNFEDTPPSTSQNAGGVVGIDDENSPPPLPTENADPLGDNAPEEGSIEVEPFVFDENGELQAAGASIPEPEDG